MDTDRLVDEVSARIREALAEAERKAREMIAEAEREAEEIRKRAERDAQQRLAQVRQALAGLEGALGGEPGAEVPAPPEPEPSPGPAPVPEPSPPPVPEPAPPDEPEPMPPEPEIEPPAPEQPDRPEPAANGGRSNDTTAARIVATKMALDGASRDEIAARLRQEYDLEDLDGLLDDVLARASR